MLVKSSTSSLFRSQLFGCSEVHLVDLPQHFGVKVHQSALAPLIELMKAAKTAGFELQVASGFRGFERQLLIWNKKCCGERPVFDRQGNLIDIQPLSPLEKVEAILHWSALPGASRHHWGTDCDIYDAAVMPSDYQLQLHPEEYTGSGLFAPMMTWLSEYLQRSDTPDFYHPYLLDSGGVAPEPWHISYRPIAARYEQQMTVTLLRQHLQQLPAENKIEEQQTLLDNLEAIFPRFIQLTKPSS
ncbi:MAG: LAS superfamily LD-carboxypeptidase LdcB [Candidatus Endobugula sp.]|jgi:LAS superfamily LD-carboxypeptidase LdcB